MERSNMETNNIVHYDDRPVKWMIYPSLFFILVGMTIGVFIAFNGFIFPDYFSGEYIHFGKLRPMHVSTVTILWLLSADIGLIFFMVQRLCGIALWNSHLALFSVLIWWFSVIIGTFSFPWGTNFGWEYAEMPMWVSWLPIKALMTFAWILMVINIFMTIAHRRHERMYVSLWYIMGTCVWTTLTMWVGGFGINMIPGGISRVNASFFFVHNLVGLIFTPMGLAAAYYFLPKLANVPIYSHRLSMIGFWTVSFVYGWIGAHHILHGPMSQWLQTVAIIFSIWLFIPVWTVVFNIAYTLKPHWKRYIQSAPIRFIMMGNIFYLITCIQGPLMALRNVAEITSKTDWIVGHSHISLFATFSFFASAGIYYVVPVITKNQLWSQGLAKWHFRLTLIGTVPFIMSLWIGGFFQGWLWSAWAEGPTYAQLHASLTRLPFLDTIAAMRPWWILRGLGGIMILTANILFVVNMFNTMMVGQKGTKEEVLASIR